MTKRKSTRLKANEFWTPYKNGELFLDGCVSYPELYKILKSAKYNFSKSDGYEIRRVRIVEVK